MTIRIAERPSQLVRRGVGADNERSLQGLADIRDENFLGAGMELGATIAGGARNIDLVGEYKAPRIFDTYLTASLSAFYRIRDSYLYADGHSSFLCFFCCRSHAYAPPILTMMIGLPVALFYIFITYSFSVQSVISAAGARPANPQNREEKLLIYKVEEMSIAAGLPMPKVYVQESRDINAFATGHKPQDSIICATTGALQQLNTEELEGVIGHEMSHIRNRDIFDEDSTYQATDPDNPSIRPGRFVYGSLTLAIP